MQENACKDLRVSSPENQEECSNKNDTKHDLDDAFMNGKTHIIKLHLYKLYTLDFVTRDI